jgi:hypothetical protein
MFIFLKFVSVLDTSQFHTAVPVCIMFWCISAGTHGCATNLISLLSLR